MRTTFYTCTISTQLLWLSSAMIMWYGQLFFFLFCFVLFLNYLSALFLYSDLAIKEFFEFFRATFPGESITLKMHILEEHVLPEIQFTGFGLGLLSEQGGELIHRKWNLIKESTASIGDPVKRLVSTLKKYSMRVMPEVIVKIRHPRKKKGKEEWVGVVKICPSNMQH